MPAFLANGPETSHDLGGFHQSLQSGILGFVSPGGCPCKRRSFSALVCVSCQLALVDLPIAWRPILILSRTNGRAPSGRVSLIANGSREVAGMATGKSHAELAAIVAADVAGYSRLIAADEEATLAALRTCRIDLIDPKIAEHRGRVANTAGDSILIEFPSVIDALRCMIDMQRGMAERNAQFPDDRRIQFRVGLNLGDVVYQDGDLLGDGVNVAARLEGLAEPGGICISRAARDQIRDRMDVVLEDLGEVDVKNIPRPVRAFRVLANGISASARPSRRQSGKRAVAFGVLAIALIAFGVLLWRQPWVERVEAADVARMAFLYRTSHRSLCCLLQISLTTRGRISLPRE